MRLPLRSFGISLKSVLCPVKHWVFDRPILLADAFNGLQPNVKWVDFKKSADLRTLLVVFKITFPVTLNSFWEKPL